MAGMEKKMASTMATFIQVQNASVGEVKTSSVCSFASGLEMKRMAGSVTKNAMTSPTPAEPSAHMMRVRSSPRCSMNDILPRARSCSGSGAGCSSVITTPSGSARRFPRPAVHCQELPTSASCLACPASLAAVIVVQTVSPLDISGVSLRSVGNFGPDPHVPCRRAPGRFQPDPSEPSLLPVDLEPDLLVAVRDGDIYLGVVQ